MKKIHLILPAIASLFTLNLATQVQGQPVVKPQSNGNYQVIVGQCSSIFNSAGSVVSGGQYCDDKDLFEAKQALKSYLAEQGGSGQEHQNGTHGTTPENLYSKTPPALQNLVGVRAAQGENDLKSRGYTYRNTVTFEGGKSAYYIENKTGYCVEVGTVEGRFSSIVYNSSDRCAQ